MPQPIKDILSAQLPLSVVVFLIVQTMASVWWASNQVGDVHLEMGLIKSQLERLIDDDKLNYSQESRIIVLEQEFDRTKDDVHDIKDALKQRGMDLAK